jgi:hypothetical protein
MRYLKLFESLDIEPGYYRIPYGNILDYNLIKISVNKIPVSLTIKNKILEILKEQLNKTVYACIYLIFKKEIDKSAKEDWGFWGIHVVNGEGDLNGLKDFVKHHNIPFKSDIILEPYEIEADKYNL